VTPGSIDRDARIDQPLVIATSVARRLIDRRERRAAAGRPTLPRRWR